MRCPYRSDRCRPATWYRFFTTSRGCVASCEKRPNRNLSAPLLSLHQRNNPTHCLRATPRSAREAVNARHLGQHARGKPADELLKHAAFGDANGPRAAVSLRVRGARVPSVKRVIQTKLR